jgi:Tfp pilus assembly protein PilX
MMVGRLIKEEAGMTMGLVVIMIVLIGVMGAGLLTFVQRDLESVVAVNQGQRAFDVADAGVQAAEMHLNFDNIEAHYDIDDPANTLLYDANCDVTDTDEEDKLRTPAGEDWSPTAGVTKNFAGGQFTVNIRWLGASSGTRCKRPGPATAGTTYFRVVSTGTYGDATRRVEAIHTTQDSGAPRAFYAQDDIDVKGTACINNVSLFSESDILVRGSAKIKGTDLAYKSWAANANAAISYSNDYNATPRTTDAAGIGAVGTITQTGGGSNPDCTGSAYTLAKGTRDFDTTTTPEFLLEPTINPQPSSQITFPFQPTITAINADALCDRAKQNEDAQSLNQFYYQQPPTTGNYSLSNWPADSDSSTIVCVDYAPTGSGSRTVNWNVGGGPSDPDLGPPYPTDCSSPDGTADTIHRGILIVRYGNFSTAQNKNLFSGVIVVRGMGVTAGDYDDAGGNTCTEGFANTSGAVEIKGNVQPSSIEELGYTPAFHDATLWSWRELYK